MTSLCSKRGTRSLSVFAICGLFLSSGDLARANPQELVTIAATIPDGTPVHLYLLDDLNSKKNKDGDGVRFKVRESIRVGDIEVISAGSAVVAHVGEVGRRRFPGHSGQLRLLIDYAVAVNGAKIPLRGEATLKGGSNGGVTAASTTFRGWEADIHKGTLLNAYVNGDQTLSLGNAAPSGTQTASTTVAVVTINTAALLGLTVATWEGGGAEITAVAPKSPAQTAGLHVGYVIHTVDQKPVLTAEDFERAFGNRVPGTAITIGCAFRSTAMGWMPKEVTLRPER